MSALINRDAAIDAIARSRYERFDSHYSMPGGLSWDEYKVDDPDIAEGLYRADAEHDLNALLASGAVVDAATLADDETLVRRLATESAVLSSNSSRVRITLRALATALSERGDVR